MQVLVATCQESADLVTISEESDPFLTAKFALENHSSNRLFALTNIIQLFVADSEGRHRDITELNLFIKHVHRGEESTLNVVFDVVCPHFDLMHKAGVLCAAACGKYR